MPSYGNITMNKSHSDIHGTILIQNHQKRKSKSEKIYKFLMYFLFSFYKTFSKDFPDIRYDHKSIRINGIHQLL